MIDRTELKNDPLPQPGEDYEGPQQSQFIQPGRYPLVMTELLDWGTRSYTAKDGYQYLRWNVNTQVAAGHEFAGSFGPRVEFTNQTVQTKRGPVQLSRDLLESLIDPPAELTQVPMNNVEWADRVDAILNLGIAFGAKVRWVFMDWTYRDEILIQAAGFEVPEEEEDFEDILERAKNKIAARDDSNDIWDEANERAVVKRRPRKVGGQFVPEVQSPHGDRILRPSLVFPFRGFVRQEDL